MGRKKSTAGTAKEVSNSVDVINSPQKREDNVCSDYAFARARRKILCKRRTPKVKKRVSNEPVSEKYDQLIPVKRYASGIFREYYLKKSH